MRRRGRAEEKSKDEKERKEEKKEKRRLEKTFSLNTEFETIVTPFWHFQAARREPATTIYSFQFIRAS